MTDSDKKQWSTPRLRIFVRTRAEEAVLHTCKLVFPGNKVPGTTNTACVSLYSLMLNDCGACSSTDAS